MSEESKRMSDPYNLVKFIVQQTRQWKLLGNTLTTLLSHGEELQIMQYCLAQRSKEATGVFNADPKQSNRLLTSMKKQKSKRLERIIEYQLSKNKEEKTGKEAIDDRNVDDVNDQKNSCVDDDLQSMEYDDSLAKSIEKELELESGYVSPIFRLFRDNLKFSNHITVMDVYEAFIKEFLKKDSKFVEQLTPFNNDNGTILLEEDSEMYTLEFQILRLLRNDNCLASFDKSTVETLQSKPSLDMSIFSSPKTPRVPKTLSSSPRTPHVSKTPSYANESTPRNGCKLRTSSPSSSLFSNTPLNKGERLELQKKFIENIFQCYLHLLVNPRCELALATVFNIPDRELDHEAFTHLKHLTSSSKLSMYQTMSTFLMRIRLGGRSYAPSSDQPLMAYVKGLGNLLDLLDKMQTVMEEVPQPRSVCRQLINIIKSSLSSCRSGKFSRNVIETVAENIFNNLTSVLEGEEAEKTISNEGSLTGHRSLLSIQHYLDIAAVAPSSVDHYMLSDVRFSEDTPTRFPSLLTKFRSPMPIEEESTEQEDEAEVKEDPSMNKKCLVQRVKASEALFLDGSNDDDGLICTPSDLASLTIIPSKTIVHPGKFVRELIHQQNPKLSSATSGKAKKRPNGNSLKDRADTKREKKDAHALGGKENSTSGMEVSLPPAKKSSVGGRDKIHQEEVTVKEIATAKKGKSCRRKLMVQVKGQSKLTGFFKT